MKENVRHMPAGYDWSVITGFNNGVGPAPVWVTTLPNGLVVEVWENRGAGPRYSAQAALPAEGYVPGSLYPVLDALYEPEYLRYTETSELASWLGLLV